MPKNIINGIETKQRIQIVWDQMLEDKIYLSVTEFCKKVGISSSTLYHCYKEWADKVTKRRDSKSGIKRKMIPTFKYNNQGESLQIIEKLRLEVNKLNKNLIDAKKEIDKLSKLAKDSTKYETENERLRAVIMKSYDIIIMYIEPTLAHKIIDEISNFQESHLHSIK